MSKPVFVVKFKTLDGKTGKAKAVLDTGSYYSIMQKSSLPRGAAVIKYKEPFVLGTADKKGKLKIKEFTGVIIDIYGHPVMDDVLISDNLKTELIIGVKTMQAWDISIKNTGGKTSVCVGRDMNDPEIQMVLHL